MLGEVDGYMMRFYEPTKSLRSLSGIEMDDQLDISPEKTEIWPPIISIQIV
jgi:hypothetical protein